MDRQIWISPSQIATFERCSLKWFFEQRAKIRTRPTSYFAIGNSVHSSVEANYLTKKETGEPAPLDIITDIAADTFAHQAQRVLFAKTERPSLLKDEAVKLAELHYKEFAPTVEPKEVEVWLDVVVTPPAPKRQILIRQRADAVTVDGRIVDTKTSTTKDPEESVRINTQLTSYALGYKQKYGIDPTAVSLHRLIRKKTKDKKTKEDIIKPEPQNLTGTRGEADYGRYLHKVAQIADRMERLDVWPVDDPKVCRMCPFTSICWGKDYTAYLKDPALAREAANKSMGDILE